ncbi:hypothetical protein OG735_01515 [Streptomyces sp. NBC_01210]|uniref:hypothetical protein n=1 Tax=Streptomyces sp. NBC_01210 TaxID=2903774 RepID=UPI002E164E16|nr:hypothetical protein OG735_01515 [Streptomyces sp. NBC_01210]
MQATVQTPLGATLSPSRLAQKSPATQVAEAADELGQVPALTPLFSELPGELRAVDAGLHGIEHQTLKRGRFHIGRSGYWNLRSYSG